MELVRISYGWAPFQALQMFLSVSSQTNIVLDKSFTHIDANILSVILSCLKVDAFLLDFTI